jgi:ATP-dependent Clp protease ATP-binding subunit ClpB
LEHTYLFKDNLHKALEIAYNNQNILVHPEHFILAMLINSNSVFYKALNYLKINIEEKKVLIQKNIDKLIKPKKFFEIEHIKMSEELFETISLSKELQKINQDNYLALDTWIIANINYISNILKIEEQTLIKTLKVFRGGKKILTASLDEENSVLNKYCINLNEEVLSGKINKTIGREVELNRLMKILLRKDKNTPVIIGEQGIGKTNLIKGLTFNIVEQNVPISLLNKVIYSLDLSSLIAGAIHQGELEDRLKSLLIEIRDKNNVILFIDDIHNIIKNEDLLNTLKPYLNRNEINLIGTTTNSDYKLYMENDSVINSRLQLIKMEEPSEIEAIQIMKGIKDQLELHHNVLIEDKALISAVELSQRYITNKNLPDKAIDLIDEAAAELKMEIETEPYEIFELKNDIRNLKEEKEHLLFLEKKTADIENIIYLKEFTLKEKTEKYNKEKKVFDEINITKNKINQIHLESKENFSKELIILEKKLNRLKQEWESFDEMILKNSVNSELVSKIISNWTGIPLSKMNESETEKIINMKNLLSGKVIGQDEVVNSISKIIQKNKAGLSDSDKPIGSFIFLGTSGVGKTHMAKELAKFLFNDANKMIRFDMSEYQDKSTISRLTGAAPGLIGYEEGGQLTEAVKNNPYSVILFDEVEKAHPDIFNLLLQVLDDGRLTDNKGTTVDFKNTIIILTSNIGSSKILEIKNKDLLKDSINTELRSFFRPEFLNRLDELIIFNPLEVNDLVKITSLLLKDVQKKLDRRNIKLIVSEDVKNYIANIGYNPLFGARPLRRAIDEYIEEKLTIELLKGSLKENNEIEFYIENEVVIYDIKGINNEKN